MRRSTLRLADFEIKDVLGKGGFGVVKKAFWKEKGKDVAIKMLNSDQRSERERELLRLEVENHQKIDHPNIVKFYGYFKEDDMDYIVMELCKEGSLSSYIKRNGELSPDCARKVMYNLVSALECLHSQEICHRDLSSGNVLIDIIRNETIYVKICDFGLAKAMKKGRAAHTMAGTPGYMDPQVANRKNYGLEVDLYSLGCLLYLMLTGQEPSNGHPDQKFPRLKILEQSAVQLIRDLTEPNLKNRIILQDVKRSAFMVEVNHSKSERQTSIHSRRSVERRAAASIERLSIRDRSKSRGALRERNGSPLRERNRSPPGSTRQIYRSRASSQVRSTERSNKSWPVYFDRLAGKREASNEYNLEIVNEEEGILREGNTKDGIEIMKIQSDSKGQKVGIPIKSRNYSSSRYDWFYSMDELSHLALKYYNIVLQLLDDIRWKVAKVIFNNSSICKGGVIRLMENGDLRVKDAQGKRYSVRKGSKMVEEGDPRKPTGYLQCPRRTKEILGYLDLCTAMEEAMQRQKMPFPFISYDITDDTKTADRNVREAIAESSRVPISTGHEVRNSSRGPSDQRISREIKSSRSYARKPVGDAMATYRSDPAQSLQQFDKENVKPPLTILRNKSGGVVGVKVPSDKISLRVSASTPNQYIYTDSNDKVDRFTFTGNYSSIDCPTKSFLLKKLIDKRNER